MEELSLFAGLPKQILVATSNVNKLREIQTVAKEFQVVALSPVELATHKALPSAPEVEETGSTFLENAQLKALRFSEWSGGEVVLADDSGLVVDALGGAPGVYSARFGGEGLSYAERIELLLEKLRSVGAVSEEERRARFLCQLVLMYPDGRSVLEVATLDGYILHEPRGSNGFGYDPIVYLYDLKSTLAEVEFSVTCSHGFRAKGVRNLFSRLRNT